MASEIKARKRGNPYDPDAQEMRDELGQLRRRAERAGRTMAEQSAHEADAGRDAMPRSHGYGVARLLGWDANGRVYDAADPMLEDRYR